MGANDVRHGIRHTFIYDWYDGPTAGAAKSIHGSPVTFQFLGKTRRGEWGFLLMPLAASLYDGLVMLYGMPPVQPSQGIVIGFNDESPEVISISEALRAPGAGNLVICQYNPDFPVVEELVLSASQVWRLLNSETEVRNIDALLER